MKPDQEKVRVLLVDTVALLCKNGLSFKKELKIQGLLGITVDESDVFIVHINEVFTESPMPTRRSGSDRQDACGVVMVPEPVAEFNQSVPQLKPHAVPFKSGTKAGRKRLSSGRMDVQPVKLEKGDWGEEGGGPWSSEQPHRSKAVASDVPADVKEEAKDDDILWMGTDATAVSASATGFDSQLAQDFNDDDDDLLAYDQSIMESFDTSDIGVLPVSVNCESLKTEPSCDVRTASGGRGNGVVSRRAGRKRSSKGSEAASHATSASFVMPVDDGGNNWQENDVSGQYPASVETGWDQDEENMLRDDCQEWSPGWENNRGSGKRLALNDDREKTFVCQYEDCDKAFYRKDHLIRHQRIKHGKPFGVDSQVVFYCHFGDCGRMFYKNASLHRHMNEAHGYSQQE